MSNTSTTTRIDDIAAMFAADMPEASADSVRARTALCYGLGTVANITAMCIAFSCSGFWIGFITYVVVGLLLALIAAAASLALNYYISDDKFEAAGAAMGSAWNKVTGLFTRNA